MRSLEPAGVHNDRRSLSGPLGHLIQGDLGLGLGWLWVAISLLMVIRAGSLLVRFAGDRWLVLGA